MKSRINYKKTQSRIKKQKHELDKESEKVMCCCPHKKDGQATLMRKKREDGTPSRTWVCYQCEKPISLERIPDEKLEEAIRTIDNAIDIVKLTCREGSEKDNQLHEKMSKTQYRIRNSVMPAYKTSLTVNSNNNDRRDRRTGSIRWG